MTFKEFVESRRHVDDIGAAIDMPEIFDSPAAGFVYADNFYIHDPCEATGGEYFTEIENDSPVGPLHKIERLLYKFAAEQSPDWVDHDFIVIHTVEDEERNPLGVIECVVDEGFRPRRVSDSLPYWISDWFLRNYENLPSNWKSFGFRLGPQYFMV